MQTATEKIQKVGQTIQANPHIAGDATAVIPTSLVWLEQAPNIAALMTILWFVYRFLREIHKSLKNRNKN